MKEVVRTVDRKSLKWGKHVEKKNIKVMKKFRGPCVEIFSGPCVEIFSGPCVKNAFWFEYTVQYNRCE